ncbi:MAG TPA: DEAD/DEAH box helicase, partial [Herpetosiphonaceae bacterium]
MTDRSPELFADVAVRVALFRNPNAVFTYYVPPALHSTIEEGALVWVPFGRQRVQGIVVTLYSQLPPHLRPTPDQPPVVHSGQIVATDLDPNAPTIRPIDDLSAADISIPVHLLRLARWMHGYYRVPLWDALELLLPPGSEQQSLATWRATPQGMSVELGTLPAAERGLLYYLRRQGEVAEATLHAALHGSPSELRRVCLALKERGLIARGVALTRPKARTQYERMVRLLIAPGDLETTLAELARAPRQAATLAELARQATARAEEDPAGDGTPLLSAQGIPLMTLRDLAARKYIEIASREVIRNPLDGAAIQPDQPPELSPSQARVLGPITEAITARQHAVFLLHGVTGSGKTELYLRAIARSLRRGRQALVLVPEIALTAQLVRRFAARFGEQVVVLHSGLSLGERYDTWRRLRRGAARVVVGSRSAVFAPLP